MAYAARACHAVFTLAIPLQSGAALLSPNRRAPAAERRPARCRDRKALLATAVLLLLPTLPAVAAARKPSPPPPSEPPSESLREPPAGTRSAARWPFSVDSPWNTPLGAGAQLAPAASPCSQTFADSTAGSDINAAEWSHPIYVARPSDPLVRLYLYGEVKLTLHVPRDAMPARPHTRDTDGHLHIIDPTHRFVDELYHARRRPGGHLQADAYSRNDLHGDGVGKGGVRAYGGSAIAGLIRTGELATGLRHALALALPRRAQRVGPVWPATAEDDFAAKDYRGSVPLGQLVALPRDLDAASLHLGPAGQALLRALQDYGAYDVDSAGDYSLYAEPAAEGELGSARKDWATLRPLLRCVTNNRPDAIGGPGPRVAPPALPLAPK